MPSRAQSLAQNTFQRQRHSWKRAYGGPQHLSIEEIAVEQWKYRGLAGRREEHAKLYVRSPRNQAEK
jgi:hypothetical protein